MCWTNAGPQAQHSCAVPAGLNLGLHGKIGKQQMVEVAAVTAMGHEG